ncbi:hypothetical protein H0H81_007306 [Sphagnurus paluster]|uniref:F-box domain-containing protein n=1 Tax=Sphagnurus paluster TaxID=117069 RepID=A0A9P7FT94_9AGAR|nr:hypothetical protein H0H81_007306 [Sphagnurus paluster]
MVSIRDLPNELHREIFCEMAERDLLALATVSSDFQHHAEAVLYAVVNLTRTSCHWDRVISWCRIVSSNPRKAKSVHALRFPSSFKDLPPSLDNSLDEIEEIFRAAFTSISNLRHLFFSAIDTRFSPTVKLSTLSGRCFRLSSLSDETTTLLGAHMEQFLSAQPDIVFWSPTQHFLDSCSSTLPKMALPRLRTLFIPDPTKISLTEGRPVEYLQKCTWPGPQLKTLMLSTSMEVLLDPPPTETDSEDPLQRPMEWIETLAGPKLNRRQCLRVAGAFMHKINLDLSMSTSNRENDSISLLFSHLESVRAERDRCSEELAVQKRKFLDQIACLEATNQTLEFKVRDLERTIMAMQAMQKPTRAVPFTLSDNSFPSVLRNGSQQNQATDRSNAVDELSEARPPIHQPSNLVEKDCSLDDLAHPPRTKRKRVEAPRVEESKKSTPNRLESDQIQNSSGGEPIMEPPAKQRRIESEVSEKAKQKVPQKDPISNPSIVHSIEVDVSHDSPMPKQQERGKPDVPPSALDPPQCPPPTGPFIEASQNDVGELLGSSMLFPRALWNPSLPSRPIGGVSTRTPSLSNEPTQGVDQQKPRKKKLGVSLGPDAQPLAESARPSVIDLKKVIKHREPKLPVFPGPDTPTAATIVEAAVSSIRSNTIWPGNHHKMINHTDEETRMRPQRATVQMFDWDHGHSKHDCGLTMDMVSVGDELCKKFGAGLEMWAQIRESLILPPILAHLHMLPIIWQPK